MPTGCIWGRDGGQGVAQVIHGAFVYGGARGQVIDGEGVTPHLNVGYAATRWFTVEGRLTLLRQRHAAGSRFDQRRLRRRVRFGARAVGGLGAARRGGADDGVAQRRRRGGRSRDAHRDPCGADLVAYSWRALALLSGEARHGVSVRTRATPRHRTVITGRRRVCAGCINCRWPLPSPSRAPGSG